MFKLVLEKAEEPEIKLPTSAGSWKKQKSSRKASIEEAVFSSLCIFANFVIDEHIYVGFGEGDGTPLQ